MIKVLKTFYKFLLRRKVTFILFLVLVVIASALNAIQPYFYKLFVEAIPSGNYQNLIYILFAYVGVKVAELFFSVINFIVGDMVMIESSKDARASIFKHVQDLDFAFHSSKSTGSLISAFKRGDGAFYSFFHSIHHRILEIGVGVVVMVVFLSQLDWKVSVLVFTSFVIALIISKFVISYNVTTRSRFNKEEDKISGIIVDNMINYETVKLFAKEDWELARLKSAFIPWTKYFWEYANSFRVLDISIGSLINISIFLILFLGLGLLPGFRLDVPNFVLVIGFLNSLYPRIYDLIWGIRDIAKNYTDIETYFGLLDYEIAVKDPVKEEKLDRVNGEIHFNNVSFSYKEGKARAIRNIEIKVRQGQSVALVGRSGVGKTTLVRLLMRFFDVDSGKITIDGVDIREFSKSRLRSFMGVVPQEPILFNNTIGYNIAYGADNPKKEEIEAAAKLANLDDFIEGLPKKYDTHVGERGIKLSGGQKQRLAIARMILSDPDIIIFDEATSQLDSESEILIQDAFWKAAKNKTTIIIAHRLSTVKRADKIVVMEKGRIAEVGSHKELLAKSDSLYSHFWGLQTRA